MRTVDIDDSGLVIVLADVNSQIQHDSPLTEICRMNPHTQAAHNLLGQTEKPEDSTSSSFVNSRTR